MWWIITNIPIILLMSIFSLAWVFLLSSKILPQQKPPITVHPVIA